MPIKRHKKASEVFESGRFTFCQPGLSFEERYPTIEDVTVKIKETGSKLYFGRVPSVERTYPKNSFGEFIDCSNPKCYGGGFSIGRILNDMVRNNKTHLETSEFCMGCEASPKLRRWYPCDHYFKIKVDLKYKEPVD